MAVLELLARATRTGIVTSRQFVFDASDVVLLVDEVMKEEQK